MNTPQPTIAKSPDLKSLWAALESSAEQHSYELELAKHAMFRLRFAYSAWQSARAAYESAAGLQKIAGEVQ
jgi:hypothetical protein